MSDIKEQYEKAFKMVKPEVTAEDRKDAAKELSLHPITINTYASGNFRYCNVDTADKLLKFFTGRIKQRKEKLNSVLNSH
jgi:hypothetical protein